ncbi:MAG: PD-(D/E)XK nuclease family protein, partial [Bacteroidota bacterium]
LGRGELGEFLDYLAALEGLAVREGEVPLAGADDAVLLLTVHRAKGLEFPVVFLPDLGRALASHSPTLLVAEDGRAGLRFGSRQEGKASPVWCELDDHEDEEGVAEAKRLLYVALTRARDRLILVGSGAGRGRSWLGWLQETIPLPSAGGTAAYPGGTVRVVRPEEFLSAPPEPAGPGTRFDLPVRTEAAAAREARPAPLRRAPGAGAALTVSGALLLRACPRRFHLRHVLGLPERSPGGGGSAGGGSALGTLVHALAAAGAGEAETAAALETARRDLPPGADRDLERLVAHYRRAESCRALAEAAHVWTEYEFQLALEGGRLAGACDLVWLDAEGAAHLADLKTNRVAVPGGELLAEHAFQVRLYGLALRRLFARLDRRARLEYLWPGVGVDVPLGEEHLAQTEAELVSLLRQAAAGRSYGEFPPRPGASCRRCGYREGICDAAGSADDPS